MPKDTLERPDDLITAEEAGRIAGRKKDTIRSWVRNNMLTGYRENPMRMTSALMVSTSDLLLYLSMTGKPVYRAELERLEGHSQVSREKDKEIERLKRELEVRQIQCHSLELQIGDLMNFNETLQMVLNHRSDELSSLRNQLHIILDLQGQSQIDYRRISE